MSDGKYILPSTVAEALLPINLWATFGRALLDAMPDKYREEIGRKAIEGASFVDQLETINASRAARGVKPLTMGRFMSGMGDDE
jgi:hypothetical protein